MITRRRSTTITTAEAMHRLRAMVRRLDNNVRMALGAEAILEAANKKVGTSPRTVFLGASAYNTIVHSLMLSLALSLARLYDLGTKKRHPNRRDIASIPLIVRLLKQPRCQNRLILHARNWTPHLEWSADIQARACERAIRSAIGAYDKLVGTREGRAMVRRLREFRNKLLAHSLIEDVIEALPTYNDLFALMDVARDVMQHAKLAIKGTNEDLKTVERIIFSDGERFWDNALNAVFTADESKS